MGFFKALKNTKRVNSKKYIGALYDAYDKPKFVNLDPDSNGILLYDNKNDDIILKKEDIEELTITKKTDWYNAGSINGMDVYFNFKTKDGKAGTLKAPIAHWANHGSFDNVPYGCFDSLNKMLELFEAGYKLMYKRYDVTVKTEKGPVRNFYFCLTDDELLDDLRKKFPAGSVIVSCDKKELNGTVL